MYIDNLCIEVTRKCNMRCAHCLRGVAQNINIDTSYIDELLRHCKDGIGSITFTGGEPTLNMSAIKRTFETIRLLDIPLGGFYIVTNARAYKKELIELLDEMYEYCYEKELCGLAISDDEFHAKYRDEFTFKRNSIHYAYDCFGDMRKYFRQNEKKTDWQSSYLLNEGRAKNIHSPYIKKRENTVSSVIDDLVHIYKGDNNIGGTLYLNALGELIDGCDWSYHSQNQHKLGNIFNWDGFLYKITV